MYVSPGPQIKNNHVEEHKTRPNFGGLLDSIHTKKSEGKRKAIFDTYSVYFLDLRKIDSVFNA